MLIAPPTPHGQLTASCPHRRTDHTMEQGAAPLSSALSFSGKGDSAHLQPVQHASHHRRGQSQQLYAATEGIAFGGSMQLGSFPLGGHAPEWPQLASGIEPRSRLPKSEPQYLLPQSQVCATAAAVYGPYGSWV